MSSSKKRSHRSGDGDNHRRKKARKESDNSASVSSSQGYYGSSSLGEMVRNSNHNFSETYGFVSEEPEAEHSPDAVTHFSSALSDDSDCQETTPRQSQEFLIQKVPVFSTSSNDDGSVHPGPKYSSVAQKLMSKMGYEPGQGLGASGSGRLEPVEASQQRGRRGLGHSVPKLKQAIEGLKWNQNLENVTVEEEVLWIREDLENTPLSLAQLSDWMALGPKKLEISDETLYCDEAILKEVLEAKTVFDSLGEREIQRARVRSNPFESIGKVFFQNRAALKMANMDAITDMMFTKPTDEHGRPLINEDNILYFADVCAAPGGFAEYAIWRRKTLSDGFPDVHGFGFTLRSNDFKLQDFYAAPRECFEPHYGEGGKSGDGDIYKANNISNFCNFVKTATKGRGVHFMMADGGFSVDGQENIQEILSKQLYLGQFVVALGIVREGGNFVCKLFDTFTPFTVGLIYLMYRCFKRVSIHKPNTSRPANSERYIICKWLRSGCEGTFSYLFEVNDKLNELKLSNMDVVHVVPPEVMEADADFVQYIRDMNNSLGRRQIVSLQKIRVFCEDNNLTENRQGQLRAQSLQAWNVPDNPRMAPVREPPTRRSDRILRDCAISNDMLPPSLVEVKTVSCLKSRMHSAYDFRFVVSSVTKEERKNRGYYLGLGGINVYRTESLTSPSWERLDWNIELPPDTLIYAELVSEIRDMSVDVPSPCDEKLEKRRHKRVLALHIIDGIELNGHDITSWHLVLRHKFLSRFCDAVNKTSRPDLLPLRCKALFRTEDLPNILAEPMLSVRQVKNSGAQRVLYCMPDKGFDPFHIPVTGLIFLQTVKKPWMMAWSRTQAKKYFYNTITKAAAFETTTDKTADFVSTMQGAMFWRWRPGTNILGNDLNIGCDFLDSDEEGAPERPALLSLEGFAQFLTTIPGMEQRPRQLVAQSVR